MKVAFLFLDEAILLGHIYDMINDDSITGHAVKYNHSPRFPKEPIGKANLVMHSTEV